MFQQEQIQLLKLFVTACESNPQLLNTKELDFFKKWLLR